MKNIALFILLVPLCILASPAHQNYVFSIIDASHGLSDNRVRYLLQLPDGRLVITTDGGLNLYDGTNFSYLHRTADQIYPLSHYQGSYHEYLYEDTLLFIKDYQSLMQINLQQEQYQSGLEHYFHELGLKEPLADLFIDRHQNLWLLTPQNHLYLRKPTEIQATHFLTLPTPSSTHSDPLYDLFVQESNLYLLYKSGLMICYDLHTAEEQYQIETFSDPDQAENYGHTSLIHPADQGFYQIRNGSSEGILLYYNTTLREWETIIRTDYTLHMLTDGPTPHTIWVAHQQGLFIWDANTRQVTPIPELRLVDGRKIHTLLNTLLYDHQGGLWIGTLNQGLLYYHPHRFKIRNIGRALFPGLVAGDFMVEDIREGPDGQIYLSCNHDQYYAYDTRQHTLAPLYPSAEVRYIFSHPEKTTPYQGKNSTTQLCDSRSWIWEGSPDGLHLWKIPGTHPTTYYTENGLINNSIRALLEDHHHDIWASTSYGLTRIRVTPDSTLQFRNYDRLDGVIDGEFNLRSACLAADGTLYFGGMDGFNQIDTKRLAGDTSRLIPLFVSLHLYGEPVQQGRPYHGNLLLKQSPSATRSLHFYHDQNFFTLCFSALNYINPSQTHYRFQLAGVDEDWRESHSPDGLLRANYTNLTPGNYTFRVRAISADGNWDLAPQTELKIHIQPPYWATPWAYGLYALISLFLFTLSLHLYIRFKRKKLERLHKEEILFVRMKNLVEECNRYQELLNQDPVPPLQPAPNTVPNQTSEKPTFPPPETPHHELLSRVTELIEQNLQNNDYSVEQLSRDLCMDRTGLYRKLTQLIDKSPTLLIRSIRLSRAAQMLEEQDLPVAEVAFRVGFSSPAYLSKCFQEEYGVTPSKYAATKRHLRNSEANPTNPPEK